MIYFLQRANGDVKIGVTVNYPQRIYTLQKTHGQLVLLGWHDGLRDVEQALHKRFRDIRVRGEWFKPQPVLKQYIENNCKTTQPPAPKKGRATRLVCVTDTTWTVLKHVARHRKTTIAAVVEEIFASYKEQSA